MLLSGGNIRNQILPFGNRFQDEVADYYTTPRAVLSGAQSLWKHAAKGDVQ
jgi:hypothetical protein